MTDEKHDLFRLDPSVIVKQVESCALDPQRAGWAELHTHAHHHQRSPLIADTCLYLQAASTTAPVNCRKPAKYPSEPVRSVSGMVGHVVAR